MLGVAAFFSRLPVDVDGRAAWATIAAAALLGAAKLWSGRAITSESMRFRLGDHVHDITDRALVMGILNRTPDSFFDAAATYATSTPSSSGPTSWSPRAPTSSTWAGSRPAPGPT